MGGGEGIVESKRGARSDTVTIAMLLCRFSMADQSDGIRIFYHSTAPTLLLLLISFDIQCYTMMISGLKNKI